MNVLSLILSSYEEAMESMASGDYEAAISRFQQVLVVDPKSYNAKFQVARALSYSGHRDTAIQRYSELLERNPINSDVLLGSGRVFTWESRYQEAEKDLLLATSTAPNYGDAWSALGDLYY